MKITQQIDCTGCGACMSACTESAITMRPDGSGHIYPHIDDDRCVSCEVCGQICPANSPVQLSAPIAAYAMHAKKDAERDASASGAAATTLAYAMVKDGGIVYGCVQDDYRNIYHCRIDKAKDVPRIRGAKYMQSDMRAAYAECHADLKEGRKVLFIGTPCQIAGLRAYLKEDYKHLYTVDILCSGMPSQLMFRDNIDIIRTRCEFSEQSCGVFLRRKGGKIRQGMYIHDGKRYIYTRNFPNDYFIAGYNKGLLFRPNCFDCKYAQAERVADMTIGNFGGLGAEKRTSMNKNKGVSLVMVNTAKGEYLLKKMSANASLEQRTVNEAVSGNAPLRQSSKRPSDYDAFHKCYREHGYEEACKRHLDFYIKRRLITMFNDTYPWLTSPHRTVRKAIRRLF